MFDKFGEFDSVEELNQAAAGFKAEGDLESLYALAQENGIDKEDAEDYADDVVEELANTSLAAMGKLKMEGTVLKIAGILTDWQEEITKLCIEDEEMARAVRKKGKTLCGCMAKLLRFAFENKEQVSDEVVKATKVTHNGKEEQMRGPVYLGMPNRAQVRKLVKEYYQEAQG